MDPVVSITMTVEQANTILGALSKLPFEQVVDLIAAIRNQAQEQLQSAAPVLEPEIAMDGD